MKNASGAKGKQLNINPPKTIQPVVDISFLTAGGPTALHSGHCTSPGAGPSGCGRGGGSSFSGADSRATKLKSHAEHATLQPQASAGTSTVRPQCGQTDERSSIRGTG